MHIFLEKKLLQILVLLCASYPAYLSRNLDELISLNESDACLELGQAVLPAWILKSMCWHTLMIFILMCGSWVLSCLFRTMHVA